MLSFDWSDGRPRPSQCVRPRERAEPLPPPHSFLDKFNALLSPFAGVTQSLVYAILRVHHRDQLPCRTMRLLYYSTISEGSCSIGTLIQRFVSRWTPIENLCGNNSIRCATIRSIDKKHRMSPPDRGTLAQPTTRTRLLTVI